MAASKMASRLLRYNRVFSFNFARFRSTETPSEQIGFIGLGNMGGPMASNLLKKGKKITVFDLNVDAVRRLQNEGASAAGSPEEIARNHKTIITMLPAGQHVKEVYLSSAGLLSTASAGTLFIDSSTIDPPTAIEVAKFTKENGGALMDAPVSGGVGAAKAGTLTFIVGGAEEGFTKAKPILECMGKNVVHCGSNGMGQAAKICNNMMLGISMIGCAEVLNLGIKLGLDPKLLTQVLNISSGRTWASEVYSPCPGVMENVPSSKNYEGGFGTALMKKDLGLAQAASSDVRALTPLGSMAHQIYSILCSHNLSEKDFSVIFKFLKGEN